MSANFQNSPGMFVEPSHDNRTQDMVDYSSAGGLVDRDTAWGTGSDALGPHLHVLHMPNNDVCHPTSAVDRRPSGATQMRLDQGPEMIPAVQVTHEPQVAVDCRLSARPADYNVLGGAAGLDNRSAPAQDKYERYREAWGRFSDDWNSGSEYRSFSGSPVFTPGSPEYLPDEWAGCSGAQSIVRDSEVEAHSVYGAPLYHPYPSSGWLPELDHNHDGWTEWFEMRTPPTPGIVIGVHSGSSTANNATQRVSFPQPSRL